jgi:hypothetical protein
MKKEKREEALASMREKTARAKSNDERDVFELTSDNITKLSQLVNRTSKFVRSSGQDDDRRRSERE